jgi:4-methyl-5(b-hydroxyethyl)-thiazole monophosphate biosynthesis
MEMIQLFADGFEEIEAITLLDLFRRVGYTVTTVATGNSTTVTGGHGITMVTDSILDEIDQGSSEALILPGGVPGVPNLAKDQRVIKLIQDFSLKNKPVIAICAAPYLLDCAGILGGRTITCYPGWEKKFQESTVTVLPDNCVIDGNLYTGRAVGAAIDLALSVVSSLSGEESADELRDKIVYRGPKS